jgi:hypothetical protein
MQDGQLNLNRIILTKIFGGLRTLEMYLEAFEHKEMTPELALGLMEDYPEAIMVLPDEFKTPEICFLAGKEDLELLKYAPKSLMHGPMGPQLCLDTLKFYTEVFSPSGEDCMDVILNLSEEARTPELCLDFVRLCPRVFPLLPLEARTPEIVREAINGLPENLEVLPINERSLELSLIAVRSDCCAIMAVPDEHRSLELCLSAIRGYPDLLRFVPMALREGRSGEQLLAAAGWWDVLDVPYKGLSGI